MLTLYHAPRSRSTRIVQLIRDMGIEEDVEIRLTDIPRRDGSGRRDPQNPHPEGKVPLLVHDGAMIRESNAVMLYLTDLYPGSPMGRAIGHRSRGAYLSWLAWYGNVFEPVYIFHAAELSHPALQSSFRDVPEAAARLSEALAERDWLVDEACSAADLLIASLYGWFREMVPDDPRVSDWAARCMARPAVASVLAEEMPR